jgi:hypothetical protein
MILVDDWEKRSRFTEEEDAPVPATPAAGSKDRRRNADDRHEDRTALGLMETLDLPLVSFPILLLSPGGLLLDEGAFEFGR